MCAVQKYISKYKSIDSVSSAAMQGLAHACAFLRPRCIRFSLVHCINMMRTL